MKTIVECSGLINFDYLNNSVKKIIVILLLGFPLIMLAQEPIMPDSLNYPVSENDSLVFVRLEQVNVFPRKGRKMNYRRYTRLVMKIRKVYPFAKVAAKEMVIYNEKFINSNSEGERRRYVRHIEKELFANHEDELKRFTISEGRYLMLLIDRETGDTSFEIIKEIKGGLPALFWQGVARIFNNDLKEKYDPVYKHYVIEQIVIMIEKENQKKSK